MEDGRVDETVERGRKGPYADHSDHVLDDGLLWKGQCVVNAEPSSRMERPARSLGGEASLLIHPHPTLAHRRDAFWTRFRRSSVMERRFRRIFEYELIPARIFFAVQRSDQNETKVDFLRSRRQP